MFLHFRNMNSITSICVGGACTNGRGNTCSTFTVRVDGLLGCKRSGRVLIGISGSPQPGIVPIGGALFKICKKVCHPMRLVIARPIGVTMASCTSPNVCVDRGGIGHGSTSMGVGVGLRGGGTRTGGVMISAAVCRHSNEIGTRRRFPMAISPRKERVCSRSFAVGGPRL